jgi:hypothetical protein
MAFQYSPKIATDNLVLYLDAANPKSIISGSTIWTDLSRGGNNGVLTNNPIFNFTNGGSLRFDGSNQFINENNIQKYFTNKLYVGVYCKLISNGNFPMILSMGGFGFELRYSSTTGFIQGVVITGPSGPFNTVTDTVSSLNKIVYIGLSYDGSNVRLYKNGVNIISIPVTGNMYFNNFNLLLGRRSDGFYFNGDIYSVQIYNRTLTDTEILQNYNTTKSRFGL